MQPKKKSILPLVIGAFLVVLLGVGTAWVISARLTTSTPRGSSKATSTDAGKLDPNVKYDTATGVLQTGGIDGEGTYHLVRDGAGENVYLTSSMVDLSVFVGKKVQVWGETLASKKAGWLMDVAKVQATK
jgi:hypothetical protein